MSFRGFTLLGDVRSCSSVCPDSVQIWATSLGMWCCCECSNVRMRICPRGGAVAVLCRAPPARIRRVSPRNYDPNWMALNTSKAHWYLPIERSPIRTAFKSTEGALLPPTRRSVRAVSPFPRLEPPFTYSTLATRAEHKALSLDGASPLRGLRPPTCHLCKEGNGFIANNK